MCGQPSTSKRRNAVETALCRNYIQACTQRIPTDMIDNGFSASSIIILPGRNYGWPVVTFRRDTPASLSEQPYTRRHGVPDIECRIRGARVVSRAFQVNLRLT
jgi:hypothetical protein